MYKKPIFGWVFYWVIFLSFTLLISASRWRGFVIRDYTTGTGSFATLISNLASNAPSVVTEGATAGTSPMPFPGLIGYGSDNSDGPKAYLNVLVFDQNYNLLSSTFEPVTSAAEEDGTDVAHEYLSIAPITIEKPGYVYIYTSNENPTPVEVFFDDFAVTQTNTPIVQKDDYYPFGLTFNSYTRTASTPNRWKFQGQEHDENTGWVMFKWRNHQPEIGRFFNVDPLAENFYYNSPYAFAENRVINGIELEGLEWENFMSKFKKTSQLQVKPVPSGKGVQNQSYNVVVANPKKALNDLRSTFKDSPQDVLNNSKAEFQPIDKDGNKLEKANLGVGSDIDIALDGPMNNSSVRVTDAQSDESSFSFTFGTLEGHVEAGEITFSATQNEDGTISFGINSTSKVDYGLAPEGFARDQQQQSWQEVLTNIVNYFQGTEQSRETTVEEDEN